MNVDSIEFPILELGRTGVDRIVSAEALTKGTRLGLTKGYLHGFDFVDSAGRRVRVLSAREAGERGWTKVFDFFTNPIVRVELELEVREKAVDLGVLKQQVVASLRKDYGAFGDDHVEDLIRAVEAAPTARAVIDAFPGVSRRPAG